MKKNIVGSIASSLILSTTVTFAGLRISGDNSMHEIKFSLDRNIVEVAKDSGVPRYQTRDIDGYVSYSANDFAPKIYGTLLMPRGSIRVGPIFSIAMYADKHNDPRLLAESIVLHLDADELVSHDTARKFVQGIVSAFGNSGWDRYLDPSCPAVTGRSTFLDLDGDITQINRCSLDPAYTLLVEDWVSLMQYEQSYQWKVADTLASLRIKYTMDQPTPVYTVWVEYETLSIKLRREVERQKKFLADGDKKGWKSSEKYKTGLREQIIEIKNLEANSIKRGDRLINR